MGEVEDGFFYKILGMEFPNEEDVMVRKFIVRDMISDGLKADGHPSPLANRMANIPEIVGRLSDEVMAVKDLAEDLEDDEAYERLVEYLVAPIAIFIERNCDSKLEREVMIEEATQKLRELLSSRLEQYRKRDSRNEEEQRFLKE